MEKDYPTQGAQGNGSKRVYILDGQKDKGINDIIASTCYVNNQPLCVLFD